MTSVKSKKNDLRLEFTERDQEAYNRWISQYLLEKDIRAISRHLNIDEEQTIKIILTSLERLRWEYVSDEEIQEGILRGKYPLYNAPGTDHTFWLSLVKACVDEQNLVKRWDKAKTSICSFLSSNFNLTDSFHMIISNTRKIPDSINMTLNIRKTVKQPTFVECCLKTVILFNRRNLGIPSDVFVDEWRYGCPNFCDWDFRRDEILFEIELEDGTIKKELIPRRKWHDVEAFKKSYKPPYCLVEKSGMVERIDIKTYLRDTGVRENLLERDMEDIIQLIESRIDLEKLKEWLVHKTDKKYTSWEEIKSALRFGDYLACYDGMVKEFLPKYSRDAERLEERLQLRFYPPSWQPGDRFLDLQKLKIELADLYLSKLSEENRIKVLEEFASVFGIAILDYECLRNIIKEWEGKKEFSEIDSFLQRYKAFYSPSKLKKVETHRDWEQVCLKIVEALQENKCDFKQASEIASKKIKKEKIKLSLRSKLTPESIRVICSGLIRKEYEKYKRDIKKNIKERKDFIKRLEQIYKKELQTHPTPTEDEMWDRFLYKLHSDLESKISWQGFPLNKI